MPHTTHVLVTCRADTRIIAPAPVPGHAGCPSAESQPGGPAAAARPGRRGGCLRADNVCYEKGIAMHSASRLAYDLAKPYGLFQAELAIDDSVGDIGSVVFRVYLDKGNGKFAPAYASPIIRGGRSPVPVSIDVDGAKRLALIVDFSDRGDAGDHANWLNARLVRVP